MRIKTELPLTLSMIAETLKIRSSLMGEIKAITTRAELCKKDDLFIALKGERFDGASFISDARKNGAYILSETNEADFKVKSSEKALLDIAAAYKKIINPKYTVAVTGSVGKTTVKDFTGALLSSKMNTHKTKDNNNNIIGVAYTLLSAPKNTEALICELGMNHKGEIDILSRAAIPDISVITNVGTAHIGNLGTRKEIAEAKLEIENGMQGGKTIVFKEEPLLSSAKNIYTVSYTDSSADLFAEVLRRSLGGTEFFIKTKSFEKLFFSELYSKHTIDSLIMAIAVCDVIGLDSQAIYDSVKNIGENNLRQRFIFGNGYKIFDDTYNSSPEAVVADLNMLVEFEAKTSALIGDMLELGDDSENLHRYIGAECAKHSLKKLYAFGKYAKYVRDGAVAAGMEKNCIFINEDVTNPELSAKQISDSYDGETLLIKASRLIRAERIIEILTKERGV